MQRTRGDGAPVSGSQYFAPRPAVTSDRREVALLLPDHSLRIVTAGRGAKYWEPLTGAPSPRVRCIERLGTKRHQ